MVKTKVVSMPLAELVEDMDLYPRHAVDPVHVQSLCLALEAGATLPPIRADRKSKRITDGWHRRRAHLRFLGSDASVDVELVDYPDEAAMKMDAAATNACHGRKLDKVDQTRCVLMLQHAGFNDSQIAVALSVPEKRIEKLTIKVAKGPRGSEQVVPGTSRIALKRSVAHMAGKRLTSSQAKAHATMPGTSFLLIARQLTTALENDLVNMEDEKLMEALEKLAGVLSEKLARVAA